MDQCSIEDCDRPRRAKGLCRKHYERTRRRSPRTRKPKPPAKEETGNPCRVTKCDGFGYPLCKRHRELCTQIYRSSRP